MDSQNSQNISSDNELDLFYSTDLQSKVDAIINGPSYYGIPGGATGMAYGNTGPYNYNSGAMGANVTIASSTGANGPAGSQFTFASSNPWLPTTGCLNVSGDAKFEGEIMWKGRNLGELLTTIEKRLAILTPNPEKLAHYESLQKAYEHYKTLEALCDIPENTDENT